MKRILTILLAAITLAACDPDKQNSLDFKAENLVQTSWEGSLQTIQGSVVTTTAQVTLKFNTSDSGQMIQKRNGTNSKDRYDMTYSVSGKKITFDCPVISGTWEVTGYMENAMNLTLLPSKKSIMTLVRE
ncbi:MAG: hypothetical protein IJN52_03885 [Bacteroidales bacterium]|nr:hypothetical protein [Bacteroidales bacterium]